MKTEQSHWYNNVWVVAIGSGLILFAVPSIWDFIKQLPFLTTLKKIGTWISIVTSIEVKAVWIIVVPLIFILLLYLVSRIRNPKTDLVDSKPILKPALKAYDLEHTFNLPFTPYKTDVLKKWRWSWEYDLPASMFKPTLKNLQPYCVVCDTPLNYDAKTAATYNGIYCPRCDKKYYGNEVEQLLDIKTLILDNIRKKYNR